ncbi:hypothetical protein SLEP1_g39086 [Rubroshorea leprosula]|uniref:Uncharacterized protein n=1 Tax=Rubroshorea leprosula TaxID=152421 RepID=A0AAV5KZ77_9ROSI|nr:hypothetical protein SLEP1_g39086 [Rubroshorea leprosula]
MFSGILTGVVKDQIGSYIYYPTTSMHKAAGDFGGLRVNSRLIIPVPYADPADDYTVLIGDWYTKSHNTLKKILESGRAIGRPNGILINCKVARGDVKDEALFTMEPGKTYKYRICNSGRKTSLNFRIQGHTMMLVEMEGSHTVQNTYESLDVHVGLQCYAVLVTSNQEPKDYYMVVSTRFLKKDRNYRYRSHPLYQRQGYRLPVSAARPNPQGSYHYGAINITRTIKLANQRAAKVNEKLRYAINGVSHVDLDTPFKLAEYYNSTDRLFKYDVIGDEPQAKVTDVTVKPIVLNMTFRKFIEIIFENHETIVQSWHSDGYSFFAMAMEPGKWTPKKRKNYNLIDAVSRHTIQVFPKSWSAILLTFDNAGMWNIRSENWERHYLGQQLCASVLSPSRSLRDEYNISDYFQLCGVVKNLPKPPPYTV